jgi:Holliday junction resolvasome RuvABC endonuclease subunit
MHNGIDIGYGQTAVVSLDDDAKIICRDQFGANVNKQFKEAVHANPVFRLKLYRDRLIKYIESNSVTGTWVMENCCGRLLGNANKLLELKGAFLMVLVNYTQPNKIFLPSATEIKKVFTGVGSATKEQMIYKAKELGYGVPCEHVADAIAMSYLSLYNYKFRRNYNVE